MIPAQWLPSLPPPANGWLPVHYEVSEDSGILAPGRVPGRWQQGLGSQRRGDAVHAPGYASGRRGGCPRGAPHAGPRAVTAV